MYLVLESARSNLFLYAKFLNTLDLGECCDALFYMRSRCWLNNDELTVLSDLSSIMIIDLCPN
jgi:hypothetical protein